MGNCTSRDDDLQDFSYTQTTINDRYFIQTPNQPYLDNEIKNLQHQLHLNQKKFNDFSRILKTEQNIIAISQLTIEIQRGAYIINENCFENYNPYVKIEIKPDGPSFETAPAQSTKPIWYKIFQFKHSHRVYKSIIITLLTHQSKGNHIVLGTLELSLQDLRNQKVHQRWYDLSTHFRHQPRLKLRIQYLHDKPSYLQKIILKYQEIMECLTQKIQERNNIHTESPEIITQMASNCIKITNIITQHSQNTPSIPKLALDYQEGLFQFSKTPSQGSFTDSKQLNPKRPKSSKSHYQSRANPQSVKSTQSKRKRGISRQFVKSIHSSLLNKAKQASQLLNQFDHMELQNFCFSKVKEFQKLISAEYNSKILAPYQIAKREKLHQRNRERDKKRINLMRKKESQEIERLKKSHMMLQESKHLACQRSIDSQKKKLEKMSKIDSMKKIKERNKKCAAQKKLLIENISSWYNDKIGQLKQKISQDKRINKILNFEEKQLKARFLKQRREKRKALLLQAKEHLSMENQSFHTSLQQNMEDLEKKLLKKYKMSYFKINNQ